MGMVLMCEEVLKIRGAGVWGKALFQIWGFGMPEEEVKASCFAEVRDGTIDVDVYRWNLRFLRLLETFRVFSILAQSCRDGNMFYDAGALF